MSNDGSRRNLQLAIKVLRNMDEPEDLLALAGRIAKVPEDVPTTSDLDAVSWMRQPLRIRL